MDGKYPDALSLFPVEAAEVAEVDASRLADAVARVALVAGQGDPVVLSFGPGRVMVSAGGDGDAQGVDEVDGADFSGVDEFEVRFNPGFLLDGLSGLDAPTARFSFTEPVKPVVVTGGAPDGGGYRYLLMPVRR